jgi:hypothetical protein
MNQTGTGTIAPREASPASTDTAASMRDEALRGGEQIRASVKSGFEDVKSTVREGASTVVHGLSAAVDDARRQASDLAGEAKGRAFSIAEEQKNVGAEQIGGVAKAVHEAADGLQSSAPMIARYVHDAATGIDRVSDGLRRKSVGEILESVEDFARTQPAAFFGATALAGFALSRFLKSSAERSAAVHQAQQPVRSSRSQGQRSPSQGVRSEPPMRPAPRSSGAGSVSTAGSGFTGERTSAGAPGAYTAAQSSSGRPGGASFDKPDMPSVDRTPRRDHESASVTSRGADNDLPAGRKPL